MAEDLMRYDIMAQNALRGAVREALQRARDHGLPGEHHFYIAFRTDAPGVQISSRLHTLYPEEITIVLQHQFWDLVVDEKQFQVRLSFNNIAEMLVIPFTSIKGFFDPSVQFGLQFASPDDNPDKNSINKYCTESDSAADIVDINDTSKDIKHDPPTEGAAILQFDVFRKKD